MRVLNLLNVRVTRTPYWTRPDQTKTAAVIIGGDDLFDSLEQTVARLKMRGWKVLDLASFKIGICLEDCAQDRVLRDMYYIAKASGFSYRIEKYARDEEMMEEGSVATTDPGLAAVPT